MLRDRSHQHDPSRATACAKNPDSPDPDPRPWTGSAAEMHTMQLGLLTQNGFLQQLSQKVHRGLGGTPICCCAFHVLPHCDSRTDCVSVAAEVESRSGRSQETMTSHDREVPQNNLRCSLHARAAVTHVSKLTHRLWLCVAATRHRSGVRWPEAS